MNKQKNKQIAIILVAYSVILLASEIFYRKVFHLAPLHRYSVSFIIIFVVVALFYFAKYRTTRILIALFFISSTLFNNIHQAVYQSWINGTNYYLMIKEWSEVAHTGIPLILSGKLWPNIIWSIVDIGIFLSLIFLRRKTNRRADIIFYLGFIYIFIHSFNHTRLADRPAYSRIKANFYAIGNAIGHVLPYELFNLSKIPAYHHNAPKQIEKPLVRNIIFIQGESASATHFSAFGYERNTSPFMAHFKQMYPDSIVKPAYSAGLLTALSLPSLFNAIPKPNGVEQIMTGKTNLFRLAKQAGFNTDFYTAQPEDEMNLISLMGKAWIDDLRYPTSLVKSRYKGMNDHKLLPWFEKINLNQGEHFIVLHQRGSHGVYGEYLTQDEKVFKDNTPLDNYDSTIYNTDLLIKKVFEYLQKQPNKDWVLIYTSDHGQNVTSKYFNQGTSVEPNYLVPILIYSPNKKVQLLIKQFEQCKRMYHQQLATFVIELLGFDMPIVGCEKGYINGRLLSGDDGYYEVKSNKKPVLLQH